MNNTNGINNNQNNFNNTVVPGQNQQTQMLSQMNIDNNSMQQVNNSELANLNNNYTNQSTQSYNDTSINDLNVDGTYNRMNVAPEYVNDQQVKENIQAPKKNTVPISKELKTVFVIALILLAFIIVMPMLFDLLNNLRYQ